MLVNTPRHDHAANPAERAIRSVEDPVRVLRPDVFEASLRDLHARRSCDSEGGRLGCEQSADWENSFFFSGGSVKLQHYCFSSSCCAGHAGSAYQSITTWMIVAGCAAGLGIYLLSVGLSYCLFTGLEPMSTGTLGVELGRCVRDKSARGRLR